MKRESMRRHYRPQSISALSGLFWPFCIFITVALVRARAQDDKTLPAADFLVSYRKILRELEATYRNARIDGSERESYSAPTSAKRAARGLPPERVTTFSYVYSDGNERLSFTSDKPKYFHRIGLKPEGGNFFTLRSEVPEGPYRLERLRSTEGDNWAGTFDEFRNNVKNAAYSPPACRFVPDHPTYISLVDSPEFTVQRALRTQEDGRPVVKVFFQYLPTERTKPSIEGWLNLDPTMNWVIKRYEYTWKSRKEKGPEFQHSGWVRYKQVNGIAVPIELQHGRSSKQSGQNTLYEISRFDLGTTPSHEFTLAAFGLGDFERTLVRANSRSMLMQVLIVSGLFLLGAVFFWMARRLKSAERRKSRPVAATDAQEPAP